jgi:hypothetical protein
MASFSRRKALTLPQQFARWIVERANPSTREAVQSDDIQKADQVLRAAQRTPDREILLDPR